MTTNNNGDGAGHDIVVIGASAGGLEGLLALTGSLPAGLRVALFVVVHTSADNPGVLPRILDRRSALPAELARDGEPVEPGRIYVAVPDRHLLVERGVVRVTRGPKENGFRAAIDPLFRTAARSYGPRVVGVVLSGGLDDGTHGLTLIKRFGGVAIVQDPEEALVPSMPLSACQNVEVDHIVPAAEIGALLVRLVDEPAGPWPKEIGLMERDDQLQPDIAQEGSDALADRIYDGAPSSFTCPECGGALWELNNGKLLRYRCHVGHGFTADSLLAEQSNGLENALWSALRALDENTALYRRLADRATQKNFSALIESYNQRAEASEQRAAVIRAVLTGHPEHGSPTGEKSPLAENGRPKRKRDKKPTKKRRK